MEDLLLYAGHFANWESSLLYIH